MRAFRHGPVLATALLAACSMPSMAGATETFTQFVTAAPAATGPAGSEPMPVIQGGVTKQMPLTQIIAVSGGCSISGGPVVSPSGTLKDTNLIDPQAASPITVPTSDCGKTLVATVTGAATATLPAAATAGAGWYAWIMNNGTGNLTLSTGGGNFLPGNAATFVMATMTSAFLSTDGTNYYIKYGQPAFSVAGVIAPLRSTTTSPVTVLGTDYFICINTTSGATIVNLPGSPATGLTLLVKDCKGSAASQNITLTPAAGNIDGAANFVMSTNHQSTAVTYDGTQWELN